MVLPKVDFSMQGLYAWEENAEVSAYRKEDEACEKLREGEWTVQVIRGDSRTLLL